jgi:predicted NACHT family NTPase
MEGSSFLDVLRQLPFVPFREIKTEETLRHFMALSLPGADEDDFTGAWTSLRKRFFLAAAKVPELRNLLSLTLAATHEDHAVAMEEKLGLLVARVEELLRQEGAPHLDDASLVHYREAVDRRYRYAETRGLFLRDEPGDGIRLEDVFVEPLLMRRPGPEGTGKKGEPETLTIGRALRRERFHVVLGPSGSGKTTLLRCLAIALCRPGTVLSLLDAHHGTEVPLDAGLQEGTVPLLFELKAFASALRADPGTELARFLIDHYRDELPSIEDLLEEGRALVLLDGYDDVFDGRQRRWVSVQVRAMAERYPRARFVMTSRPHGYDAMPLPGEVTEWQIVPFDEERIRRFFHGWYEALAGEGEGEQPAAALLEDVLARPWIRAMAENPMLSTLIVLVRRLRSGLLPERRIVFYEAAVRTLAELWASGPPGREEEERPDADLLIHALAEVAWRALTESGSREIRGEELREWLRQGLAHDPEWEGSRGARAAESLLQGLHEHPGILIELGADLYQFAHLSFHEYLTAHYVLDRLDEETGRRTALERLHEPAWEESLRLMVAGAGQARSEGLIRSILESSSGEDGLAALAFVCRCLGEKASVGRELRGEVVRRLEEAFASGLPRGVLARLAADALGAGPKEAETVRRAAI